MERLVVFLSIMMFSVAAHAAEVSDGVEVPELAHFDTTMMNFMAERNIPDGQLAVTYQGRLVLARAYTHNSPQPTTIHSRYRIASVSKPLTSTLVHRAQQDGLLTVNDTLGMHLDLSTLSGQSADPRLANVTVRQLLQHLGGFGDPAPVRL